MASLLLTRALLAVGALSLPTPTARRLPSLTAVEHGRFVALFGGEDGSGALRSDLHLWEVEHSRWSAGSDAAAHPRDLRTLSPRENERAQVSEYFDDATTGLPPPRRSHAACSAGELVFVFGGYGLDKRDGYTARRLLNDLHVFDTSDGQKRWSGELSIASPRPERRWGHALLRVGSGADARCYVFGGSTIEADAATLTTTGPTGLLNDVHYFECGAGAAAVAAVAADERARDAAAAAEGHRIVEARTGATRSWAAQQSWEWVTPAVRGLPPPPRAFFAAASVGSRLFVYGGERPSSGDDMTCRQYNDLWALETRTHTWTRVNDGGFRWATRAGAALTAPAPGSYQPATRSQPLLVPTGGTQLLLVGGVAGLYGQRLDDVWRFDTALTGSDARWHGVKDPIAHARVATQLATNDALEPRSPDNTTTRLEHGVAIDATRRRAYYFGGRVGATLTSAMDIYALGNGQMQWMQRHA